MPDSVSTPTPVRAIECLPADRVEAESLSLPVWVNEALRGARVDRESPPGRAACAVSAMDAGSIALVSGHIARARAMSTADLRAEVGALYGVLRGRLAATSAPHAVRIWNWIPGIHAPMGRGLSRYYAFNLGRFDAFCSWLGDAGAFDGALPTATGVGHDGDVLAVHMLGAARPGRAIENPRQRPAYRYSRRYGPRPPCFARATAATIRGEAKLLIGGTASVRGEDSVHPGSPADQVDESLDNVEALIRAAAGPCAGVDLVRHARVYFPRGADAEILRSMVGARLPAGALEMVRAEPCRGDLLVEIEAIADLPGHRPLA